MPSQLSTHDNDANTNAKRHLSESHVWLPIASRGSTRGRARGEGRGRVVRGGCLHEDFASELKSNSDSIRLGALARPFLQ